jgi:hypothetical protein
MNNQAMSEARELPIACSLLDSEQAGRMEEIHTGISHGIQQRVELPDGYEFRFPGGDDWLEKVAEFVRFERECCRFLTFEITSEPDKGPIRLRLRGPAGAKEFIRQML